MTEPNETSSAVTGGVVGALLVVIVIIAVGIIVLLVVRRGQKGSLKVDNNSSSLLALKNADYDGKERSPHPLTHTHPHTQCIVHHKVDTISCFDITLHMRLVTACTVYIPFLQLLQVAMIKMLQYM